MMRWDIINRLIDLYQYQSYLEIGVYNRSLNYDKIKCLRKTGVDPEPKAKPDKLMTSDAFFAQNKAKYDLIFIDGLHHSEQVVKDIDNSLSALNDNGTIVVHDCNPTSEAMQAVPRIQGEWTGDVWKAWQYIRAKYDDLSMCVLDTDYGVGIIRKGFQFPPKQVALTYSDFDINRADILNLIAPEPEGISVCIPAFEQYGHGAKTLTECLESVFMQKGIEFEVIVSDNSDSDIIKNVCNNYPVAYYHNPDKGISQNTNFAISRAGYNNIKVLYQDDKLLTETALLDFTTALQFNGWVASAGRAMNEQSLLGRFTFPKWSGERIFEKNTVGMPSVTAWRANNLKFDNNLKTLLDCDMYYQLTDLYGEPGIIKKQLVGSRYWDGSTSRRQGNLSEQEMPYINKKYFLK